MGDNTSSKNNQLSHHQVFDVSLDVLPQPGSECYDDDGRLKRTGTMWTASSHIITAVIGSGVLSLAWATAQLGWIAGPAVMILFSFVTYYTSSLLSVCYRSGDSITGKRNYTYMDAVRSNLGGAKVKICGLVQYLNLFGVAIGYTIAASISMMLVWRTLFVIITTVISMILPFFNGVVGLLGALGFWPLTVYFPVEMYIVQKKLPKWSTKWLCLQILSVACLIISIAAAAGSVAGIIDDLKSFKPFTTSE
ncbi:hypothetical protein FEM48_Zijuj06G0131200 [Ziziphus jujuba var. spinosa]|uniref:Amino acid transporter transmembrane domain-containing protein n=1 Tax=Ziziphus jujuba var. spinosa TaxID=714518 RepID=A0A978V9G4_ZIZJJ|nr:hypothetical protein FEM48_Zijuj06G0131200 [Ziziphus jujuba var. spinosa]